MTNPKYKTEEDQFSGLELLEVMSLADDIDYFITNPGPELCVKTMSRSMLERELESMGYEPSRVTEAITNLAQKTPKVESIEPKKALKHSAIGTAVGTTLGMATDLILYFATKGAWNVPAITVFGSSGGLVTGFLSYYVPIHDERLKQQELTKQ